MGGPDFKVFPFYHGCLFTFAFELQAEAPKMLEKEGKEVPGNRGYRYYGAARDLPGVRELFEEERKCELKNRQSIIRFHMVAL